MEKEIDHTAVKIENGFIVATIQVLESKAADLELKNKIYYPVKVKIRKQDVCAYRATAYEEDGMNFIRTSVHLKSGEEFVLTCNFDAFDKEFTKSIKEFTKSIKMVRKRR